MSVAAAIPQANPLAGYLSHKEELDSSIARVLSSGRYILGEEVEAFEGEFSRYVGLPFAIGVGSGTEALHLALRACGIGPGDEVVTVAHTAVGTVAAIELCGATPVFVDIDPVTFTLDPNQIEPSLTSRTKAVIPVHIYGHPASMEAILSIAHRYHLRVIEDCAQSHGAAYRGRRTGALGDVAAFSFYPTKNLGAIGDGGMVVTGNPELAERARLLREYGWHQRYVSEIPGWNTRLDALQAAILRVKLRYLDEENSKRRELAALYSDLLLPTRLQLPQTDPDCVHAYHQYVVRAPYRGELREYLTSLGIGTIVHYPVPVHLQPAYANRFGSSLPHSEKAASEILSLPIFPQLARSQVHRVASAIAGWYQEVRDR